MNTYTANYKTFRRSSIFSADNLFARRALKALLIGTALAALLTVLSPLFVGSAAVRQDTLRLHVLANSDSAEDQAVKLLVRDAILEAHSQVLGEAKTKADAIRRATEMLPEIEKIANEVLRGKRLFLLCNCQSGKYLFCHKRLWRFHASRRALRRASH